MTRFEVHPDEFMCPYVKGGFRCPEIMSPVRETPSNTEKKLFALSGLPEAPTKSACPHCSVFLRQWREKANLWGHVRHFWMWLNQKELRTNKPQPRKM